MSQKTPLMFYGIFLLPFLSCPVLKYWKNESWRMLGEVGGFSFKKPPEREVTSTPTNQGRLFDHHFFLWENGIISFLICSSRAQRSCVKISTYRSCSIRNVFWKIKRGKYKPEVTGIEKEHHLVGGFNPIWNICSSRSFPQIGVENSKKYSKFHRLLHPR